MDGGADKTSRICFASLNILYRIGDINDIKTTKTLTKISSLSRWIMHQSFVTTPPPPPHTNTHKRRIAGTTAFHASQPWDLLRGIALLFIIINSTGYTRDSQKVRGHSQLRSYLLNAFKSYFIFSKCWFHSLNNTDIKKIFAVVPKITELGYTWNSLSVPRQF